MSNKKKEQSKKSDNILLRFITNPQGEIIIQGNRSGLIYFAREVRKTAISRFSKKKLKLSPEKELSDDSSETIVLKKPKKEIKKEIAISIAQRDKDSTPEIKKETSSITDEQTSFSEETSAKDKAYMFKGDPEEIFAIQLNTCIPDEVCLTPGRLYRVEQLCPFSDDNKPGVLSISHEGSKYSFIIRNDQGDEIDVDLCIEDRRVNFFSKDELMRLYR